jgi:hypothetical protein
MAESGVARRPGGPGGGRVLFLTRFDRSPCHVGQPCNIWINIAVGTPVPTPPSAPTVTVTVTPAPAPAPAPAPTTVAQPAAHSTFQSPSGNINCMMFTSGGQIGARCEVVDHTWVAPPRSADCHLNWGDRFYLTHGGGAGFGCYGQEFPTADQTRGYGQTRSLGTITCDSEYTGMTCTDSSTGHYFRISRETYELG